MSTKPAKLRKQALWSLKILRTQHFCEGRRKLKMLKEYCVYELCVYLFIKVSVTKLRKPTGGCVVIHCNSARSRDSAPAQCEASCFIVLFSRKVELSASILTLLHFFYTLSEFSISLVLTFLLTFTVATYYYFSFRDVTLFHEEKFHVSVVVTR